MNADLTQHTETLTCPNCGAKIKKNLRHVDMVRTRRHQRSLLALQRPRHHQPTTPTLLLITHPDPYALFCQPPYTQRGVPPPNQPFLPLPDPLCCGRGTPTTLRPSTPPPT